MALPYFEEVRQVVFYMDPTNVLGTNGFAGIVFQKSWQIIGEEVLAAVQFFFWTNMIILSLDSSFMVLILKVAYASLIEQYRPINLSNFFV